MTSVRANPTDLLAMAALQRTLAARQGEVAGTRGANWQGNTDGVQKPDTGAVGGPDAGATRPSPANAPAVARASQADTAEVSEAAKALRAAMFGGDEGSGKAAEKADGAKGQGEAQSGKLPGQRELTQEEEQQVQELQARDREVRTHEQAHKAAAGHLSTSGPNYDYVTGPDGRRYANGGEVGISFGEGNTPEETLRNAETAKRAAMAPAEPSGQDRKVAAQAAQLAAQARREIAEEQRGPEADDTAGATETQGTESQSTATQAVASPPNGNQTTGTQGPAEAGEAPAGLAALFEPRRAQAVKAYNRVAQGLATAAPDRATDRATGRDTGQGRPGGTGSTTASGAPSDSAPRADLDRLNRLA